MQELRQGHHKQQDRIAATMYSLGTWFVLGICVWIPYIKETVMNIIIIIIIIRKWIKHFTSSFVSEDKSFELYIQVTVHRDNLRINNQQDASSIQNFYFITKLYMFRASTVPIIKIYQLYTWPFQPDSSRQRPHNLYETYQLPRVQLLTPDDGHRRCPKHVEFRDKLKILYI